MASRAQNRAPPPPIEDEYDDILNYNLDDLPATNRPTSPPAPRKVDLGVDEEIKITKRRITVKLDAERLLSQNGLPKLKRTAPVLLGKKLKGKGHEYSDATRILNFYQLWADDLYRKANFKDTITIIEKLGHTKRMQIARAQYLDDFRPRNDHDAPDDYIREVEEAEARQQQQQGNARLGISEIIDDDELYGPGAPSRQHKPPSNRVDTNPGSLFFGGGPDDSDDDDPFGGMPDDDELDALMASSGGALSAAPPIIPKTTPSIPPPVVGPSKPPAAATTTADEFDDDFGGMDDDWDAVMSQSAPGPSNTAAATTATSALNTDKPAEKATPTTTSIFGGGVGGGSTSIFGGGSGGSTSIFGGGVSKSAATSAPQQPPPPEPPAEEDDDELEAMYGF
ncbi:replication fork protection component Swi3-domain-containing protein [Peziza echinospora]|nr:replication fork protection component Swi3-domain-containing protein [Peziza echinospora]